MKICPADEDPCLNGALCLEEVDKKVCYCVPDHHGKLCEERYDECDQPTTLVVLFYPIFAFSYIVNPCTQYTKIDFPKI